MPTQENIDYTRDYMSRKPGCQRGNEGSRSQDTSEIKLTVASGRCPIHRRSRRRQRTRLKGRLRMCCDGNTPFAFQSDRPVRINANAIPTGPATDMAVSPSALQTCVFCQRSRSRAGCRRRAVFTPQARRAIERKKGQPEDGRWHHEPRAPGRKGRIIRSKASRSSIANATGTQSIGIVTQVSKRGAPRTAAGDDGRDASASTRRAAGNSRKDNVERSRIAAPSGPQLARTGAENDSDCSATSAMVIIMAVATYISAS